MKESSSGSAANISHLVEPAAFIILYSLTHARSQICIVWIW